jgi:hypothetical protein
MSSITMSSARRILATARVTLPSVRCARIRTPRSSSLPGWRTLPGPQKSMACQVGTAATLRREASMDRARPAHSSVKRAL